MSEKTEEAPVAERRTNSETDASVPPVRPSPGRLLIHVGLHRTATTHLQTRVFPRLTGVRYVQKPSAARIDQLGGEPTDHRPMLISHEGLLERKRDGAVRPGRMARLVELFPHAVPVLTVRRHDRWIRSLYIYNLYKGEPRSFETFVNDREPLAFMPHLRLLETLFQHPSLVLFQEELGEAPEAATELLAQWAGVALGRPGRWQGWDNRGLNEAGLRWVRRMNRRFPRQRRTEKGASRWRRNLARQVGTTVLSRFGTWITHAEPAPIIDDELLQTIRHRYRGDWIALLRTVASQRPLLAPSLRQELNDSAS